MEVADAAATSEELSEYSAVYVLYYMYIGSWKENLWGGAQVSM